jgi:general secretion pathway protein J
MKTRGFTLVEMLVAMVAFSLLAVAAAAIFSASLRSAETFERADALTKDLQIARSIMRADFSQIALRPVREPYGAQRPAAFAGGAEGNATPLVTFVRTGWDNPGGAAPRSSLQYVSYIFTDGQLVRRSRPYLDPTPETPETAVALLTNVSAVGVSFLARGQWSDRWLTMAGQGALPEAVAIEISGPGFDQIRQAFLIAEPTP